MTTPADACRAAGGDVLLAVWTQPGARRSGPAGTRVAPSPHGGPDRTAVVWRVAAPAVDGRANAALCRDVAAVVGVAAGDVQVERGGSARAKLLRIRGRTPGAVAAAVAAADG